MLLENAYPKWEEMVRSAKERIVVFTPYFDGTLVKLFKLNSDVERVLVTCINEEYLCENYHQVKALYSLNTKGVKVKHIDNLHAKLLLSDLDKITVGSQNFTNRGKNTNIETTLYVDKADEIKTYLKTIEDWLENAKNVSSELITALHEEFSSVDYQEVAQERLEKIKDKISEAKRAALRTIIDEKSNKNEVFSFSGKINYNNQGKGYYELKYDNQYNYRLSGLKMIPIINLDTLEVRFARVGQTVISKLGDGVTRTDTSKELSKVFEGYDIKVKVNLKEKPISDTNLTITLTFDKFKKVNIDLFFNGFTFSNPTVESEHKELRKLVKDKIFNSMIELPNEGLIAAIFSTFRYAKPYQGAKPKIPDFLSKSGWYRVKGIEDKSKNLFLTVKKW